MAVNLENDKDEWQLVPCNVLNTQTELIETHLNIKYLILCQSMKKPYASHDFTRYELEFVKFLNRNSVNIAIISKLLPSITNLYHIIEHKPEFYPFGVIKAYEILHMIIAANGAFERESELKRISIKDLMDIMASTSDEEEVDDVTESMWKYISAHLKHCKMHPSNVSTEQVRNIILHLKVTTQSYKSSSLRQTATDTFSIIAPYFTESSDSELLIEFADLLLTLLRDDDVYVRNRTSEIVMDLMHGRNQRSIGTGTIFDHWGKFIFKIVSYVFFVNIPVIPLAAEDHLLQWLDSKFIEMSNAWSKWLDLLRSVYAPLKENEAANTELNESTEDSHLVDVDIFDDTEPNTFDETAYTSYKCYEFLIKHINAATFDTIQKDKILAEFLNLKNL